ncbi:MAG: hypothetical protein SXU28_11555 [Pseudomonadota bacterium]|nr:hypothetical protein [Pseudomonadota bacterium]
MNEANFLHTAGFVLFNLVMLGVLFGARPGEVRLVSDKRLIFGAALPVLALAVFFIAGEGSPHSKSYTLKINTFQIPLERMENGMADEEGRFVYFVAGERPDSSDLVVPPFADTLRAAEYVRDEARPIFEITADRGGEAGAEAIRTVLCRYNYAASQELELPGWRVRYTVDGDKIPDAQGARDCSYELTEGQDDVRVALFREEYAGEELKQLERRSFRVSRSTKGVRVGLDTSISTRIATCEPSLFRLLPGIPLGETIDFLPQDNVRPAQIGAGGVNPVLEPRFIGDTMGRKAACRGQNPTFYWPASGSEDWRVSGTITRHFIPWFLLIVFAANSAVLFLLRGKTWQMERLELCVVLILQWMLTLRALIGVAGLYANPSLSRSAVILDLGMAYTCLPAMAVLLLMRKTPATRQVCVALVGMSVVSFFALVISLGSSAGRNVPIAYVAIVALLALVRWRVSFGESILRRVMAGIYSLKGPSELFGAGVIVILLALVPRFGLMAIGWGLQLISSSAPQLTERIGPLTLSAVYQPLLVVGFGCALIAVVREPSFRKAFVIAALWAITGVLMPVGLSDFGIIWIYSWPMAMVIAWFAIRSVLRSHPTTAALLSTMVMAPLLVIALAFYWADKPIPQPNAGMPSDHLQAAVDWNSRDQVRLLRYAAPEKLELLGNRRSFEMLDQAASLEPLVRQFWGRGYLEPSQIRRPIRDYQYNDNLLAIHIMWPFGRFGVVGLLAFIVGSVAILVPRTRISDAHVGVAISTIAAVTIAWAAIYMTLANLNLAPFTGRNVYLLAVTSGGDAIEGLVMILLAASGYIAASHVATGDVAGEPS